MMKGPGARKRNKKPAFIIIFMVGLIIGILASPFVLERPREKTPVCQQYTVIVGTHNVVYKNGELDVQITKNTSNPCLYEAHWTDVYHRPMATMTYGTAQDLLDDLLYYAEWLTVDQLRWYQYMLTNKIK